MVYEIDEVLIAVWEEQLPDFVYEIGQIMIPDVVVRVRDVQEVETTLAPVVALTDISHFGNTPHRLLRAARCRRGRLIDPLIPMFALFKRHTTGAPLFCNEVIALFFSEKLIVFSPDSILEVSKVNYAWSAFVASAFVGTSTAAATTSPLFPDVQGLRLPEQGSQSEKGLFVMHQLVKFDQRYFLFGY